MLKPNEVERRNSPPTLRAPQNTLTRGPDHVVTYAMDSNEPSLNLSIDVGDPDGEAVVGRLFIVSTTTPLTRYDADLVWATRDDGQFTSQTFQIAKTALTLGDCHRIELVVSGQFAGDGDGGVGRARDPLRPNDVTTATWWVQVTDTFVTSVSMSRCP